MCIVFDFQHVVFDAHGRLRVRCSILLCIPLFVEAKQHLGTTFPHLIHVF